MRSICIGVALSIFVFLAAAAQTPVASNPQALQILRQSLVALSPNIAVQDVTLSGSVHYIAGSDDETGTATLKGTSQGASRIDLNLGSVQLSEAFNLSTTALPSGQWLGPDGTVHQHALHNLFTEAAWFSPGLFLTRVLSAPGMSAVLVGNESRDGVAVIHLSVFRQFPNQSPEMASQLQHLSQIEVYLDQTTSLPVALTFNVHPDNDAHLDIPIEIRYSDFQPVPGGKAPFHIEKFINNSLLLDLTIQSAVVNSGVSASTFPLGQ
jgi:hypothetical protein